MDTFALGVLKGPVVFGCESKETGEIFRQVRARADAFPSRVRGGGL